MNQKPKTRKREGGGGTSVIQTEIAAPLGGAAVGVAGSDVGEIGVAGDDVVAEDFELSDGGVPGGAGDDAAFWIFPRCLPSRSLMLYQYVRRPHLPRRHFFSLLEI